MKTIVYINHVLLIVVAENFTSAIFLIRHIRVRLLLITYLKS